MIKYTAVQWFNFLSQELAEQVTNHYGLNMINQKITFPRDDNFSDDELAFLPYFTYFHSLKVGGCLPSTLYMYVACSM